VLQSFARRQPCQHAPRGRRLTVDAPPRAALRREHLGQHAAAAELRAGTAGHHFERRVAGSRVRKQRRSDIAPRVAAVQPRLVGEQH
jgi:hypothetical protein